MSSKRTCDKCDTMCLAGAEHETHICEKTQPAETAPERKVAKSGTVMWRLNNKFHREDGPAVIRYDGTKEWYKHGKRHRLNGPAVTREVGDKDWWVDGKRHREGGPARLWADGTEKWYVRGKLHREGAPAVKYAGGAKEWWVKGKLHREDGPAIIHSNGDYEWHWKGKRHRNNEPAVKHTDVGLSRWQRPYHHDATSFESERVVTWLNERVVWLKWYQDDKLHRDDGPAETSDRGDEIWRVNGKKHRLGEPAVKCADGRKEWWVNGKLHRTDGPALISPGTNNEVWAVNSVVSEHPKLCAQAIRSDLMQGELYELCLHSDYVVSQLALLNPKCLPEYKIAVEILKTKTTI